MTSIANYGVIKSLETYSNEFVGFVKVETSTGNVGWGQLSTYNADISAQIFHRQVAPWVIGKDAKNLSELITKVEEKEHKFPGSIDAEQLLD